MFFPFCIIIATMDNSTRINSMSNNRGRTRSKGDGNISQQHIWNQKKNDMMENSRDNSIDNVKEKGRGKRSVGFSHQHNTNWGHENVMALISCKHKEHIALKQVIDPHFNMIPTYKDGTNYQMTYKQSHFPRIQDVIRCAKTK
jgi:hypothetical protein